METNSELCKHFQRPSSYRHHKPSRVKFCFSVFSFFWVQTKTGKIKRKNKNWVLKKVKKDEEGGILTQSDFISHETPKSIHTHRERERWRSNNVLYYPLGSNLQNRARWSEQNWLPVQQWRISVKTLERERGVNINERWMIVWICRVVEVGGAINQTGQHGERGTSDCGKPTKWWGIALPRFP
jgi:hypothetical protein